MLNLVDFRTVPADGADWTPAFNRAMTAAGGNSVQGGDVIVLPKGVLTVSTLAMSGRACSFRGEGDATVIKAAAGQSGPVIDFTGYLSPSNLAAHRCFEGFVVEGDGTAGAAKKGIYVTGLGGLVFRSIAVRQTGGAALHLDGTQLCHFDSLTLITPVSAAANDIPYLLLTGPANGNRFTGVGLRSITSGADTGVSGAVRLLTALVGGTNYSPVMNHFSAWWAEFLHAAPGGCFMFVDGTANVIETMLAFDCSRIAGGARTSHYRIQGNPAVSYGGNLLHGWIPGSDGSATDFDYGIELWPKSGDIVRGVRGYRNNNVYLGSGALGCLIDIGGSVGGVTAPAVVNESGNSTNVFRIGGT